MNFKRALWVGVLTYFVSFIVGLIPMMIMGFNPSQMTDVPQSFFIIGIIISVILAALFTLLYFKDRKISPSAKEGFYFGLTLVIIGSVLDVIIFSIGSIAGGGNEMDILGYYSNPLFWVALVLFIVTTTTVGYFKSKK
jgi:hypothetical protein